MPYSITWGREELFAELGRLSTVERPIRRVVDFGCGDGHLGKGMRRALPHLTHLVGVDLWPATVARRKVEEPRIYDQVLCCDFRSLVLSSGGIQKLGDPASWDLWVFGDCLEHVEQSVARRILELSGPRLIAVRIPVGVLAQGPGGDGNAAEEHLWSFYPRELHPERRSLVFFLAVTSEKKEAALGIQRQIADKDSPLLNVEGECLYIANFILEARP